MSGVLLLDQLIDNLVHLHPLVIFAGLLGDDELLIQPLHGFVNPNLFGVKEPLLLDFSLDNLICLRM